METDAQLPIQAATTTRSAVMTPPIPMRVLLLSDHRLMRDALARALRSRADISLVGAHESSLGITAEIIESTCDVLLLDPVNNRLDTRVLDRLHDTSSLRIVMIDMDARMAEVISAVLSGSPTCQGNPQV